MPLYHMAYTIHYNQENEENCEELRKKFLGRLHRVFRIYDTLDSTLYIESLYDEILRTMQEINSEFMRLCGVNQLCDKCKLEADLCLVDRNSLMNHQNFPRHLRDGIISKWSNLDDSRR